MNTGTMLNPMRSLEELSTYLLKDLLIGESTHLPFKDELETVKYINERSGNKKNTLFKEWLEARKCTLNVSSESSEHARKLGNDALKRVGGLYTAAKYYTDAIYLAPINDDSSAMALAHANRAYVLMKLNFLEEAVDDCESALLFDYPEEKKLKVLERKSSCLKLITDRENRKGKPKVDVEELTEKSQILKHNSKVGRYIVAGEYIKEDDFIMEEKAYAFVPVLHPVEEDFSRGMCQNCGEWNIVPFPCYNCRIATYCSIKCCTEHEKMHKPECIAYKMGLYDEIGIAHLASRTLLTGFCELLEFLIDGASIYKSATDIWRKIDETKLHPDSPRYFEVLHLVRHYNYMHAEDYLRFGITALLVLSYLKKYTSFLEDTKGKYSNGKINLKDDDWELLMGAVLMRHIGQMICNAHTITNFYNPSSCYSFLPPWENGRKTIPESITRFEETDFFAAIYPRVSLYNHSCEPNIRNSFRGCKLIIRARKKIKTGEEILNCYGPNYRQIPYETRQMDLFNQYGFHCKCKHCNESDNEFKKFHSFKCVLPECPSTLLTTETSFSWESLSGRTALNICESLKRRILEYDEILSDISSIPEKDDFTGKLENCSLFLTIKEGMSKKFMYAKGLRMLETYSCCASSKRVMDQIYPVALKVMDLAELQYGKHSFNYVRVALFYIYLLGIQTINKWDYGSKYEMRKILNSFEILSKKMRNHIMTFEHRFLGTTEMVNYSNK